MIINAHHVPRKKVGFFFPRQEKMIQLGACSLSTTGYVFRKPELFIPEVRPTLSLLSSFSGVRLVDLGLAEVHLRVLRRTYRKRIQIESEITYFVYKSVAPRYFFATPRTCFMNLSKISRFWSSSDVGKPICF